jgi:hypothetical protein
MSRGNCKKQNSPRVRAVGVFGENLGKKSLAAYIPRIRPTFLKSNLKSKLFFKKSLDAPAPNRYSFSCATTPSELIDPAPHITGLFGCRDGCPRMGIGTHTTNKGGIMEDRYVNRVEIALGFLAAMLATAGCIVAALMVLWAF